MNAEDFNELVLERFNQCGETLCNKGDEYASDKDRLHNFKKAAQIKGCDPIQALDGMWLKHRVSLEDMLDRLATDHCYLPSKELIAEKLGDNHNYTLLLEGLIEDRRSALEEAS